MTPTIRILVMRHATFYAPLIGTLAGGFLEREGFPGSYEVRVEGQNPFQMLDEGEVDLMQSAVSSSWARIERGEKKLPVHFARINRRDGFWLVGRRPEPFRWRSLEGACVLADHGPQPLAMLRYAAWSNGVDLERVDWGPGGEPERLIELWRNGDGDYIHLQGPMSHLMVAEQPGEVATSVGRAMPAVAFSTVAARRDYLSTDEGAAFTRAYRRSLHWVRTAPAEEIASAMSDFFPGVEPRVLAGSIADYQALGCWGATPEILRGEYEQALDVFEWNGLITRRHPYGDVVVAPMAAEGGGTGGH